MTYRTIDGRVIDTRHASYCAELESIYRRVASNYGFDIDITETHCGDVAWQDVETIVETSTRNILHWDEFEARWRELNHRFEFVLMDNGIAYEPHGDEGEWVPAFDPETLGEGEADSAYPVFFEDADKAAKWHNVPRVLYQVHIDAFDAIIPTGVFCEVPASIVTHEGDE